jgi:hypothetical protein
MAYGHGTGIEGGPPKGRKQGVEPAHVKLGPTIPQPAGIEYQDAYGSWTTALELDEKDIATPSENRFPDAIVEVDDEYLDRCRAWLDEQIQILKRSHQMKEDEWDLYEIAYRAKPDSVRNYRPPFEEASEEVIPAIAMSVEPVVARLRTSIFKQKPVFTVTPLVKSRTGDAPAIQDWLDFKQRHHWKLGHISKPRFVDFAKLGTCIFKTFYDYEEAPITRYRYDKDSSTFTVEKTKEVRYRGSRVKGIPLQNVMIPAGFEDIEDCPIICEKVTATVGQLRLWEASGKIANVNKILSFPAQHRSDVTETQIDEANQDSSLHGRNGMELYDLWECWFEYDVDGDGYDEHLCALWHEDTRQFLMLRYNWYWHQRKPYDLAPYLVSTGTVYGIGLAEMTLPFQLSLTRWQRMASDNAWLANTRMFIAKRNAPGIEKVPRIYSGRVFFVDDPSKDFKPFQSGEIYPSTLTERQNIFGMAEKRSGVSDYLTGRESPVLGSRATATSTIALIQEGTKRVEDTLENLREMYSSIIEKAIYIEMQYGTEGLEDIVFANDETAARIKEFFATTSEVNLNGMLQISLSATDAAENKQAKQQMQLAIINLLMVYYEKSLQAATSVLQIGPQLPGYAQMVSEILTDARKMYNDLLQNYDVPDPDSYLPDLAKYIQMGQGPAGVPSPLGGGPAGPAGGPGGPGSQPGLDALLAASAGGGNGGVPQGVRGRGAPLIESLAG